MIAHLDLFIEIKKPVIKNVVQWVKKSLTVTSTLDEDDAVLPFIYPLCL